MANAKKVADQRARGTTTYYVKIRPSEIKYVPDHNKYIGKAEFRD
jgi:hypothetical protein